MTRSGSRGEDISKKQNAEFQRLSERMEQMAAKFAADLDSFKKDLHGKAEDSGTSQNISGVSDIVKLSEKFSAFEKSILSSLQSMKQDFNQLRSEMSKLNMAVNQNVILVHGVDEGHPKDLHETIIDFIRSKIGIEIRKFDVNYCYRLGMKKPNAKMPRPVVVCFCQRWLRDQIFFNKRRLKGTNFLLTELLTSENFTLYKEARNHFHNSCWTVGGRVYVISDGVKVMLNSPDKLKQIIDKHSGSESDSV